MKIKRFDQINEELKRGNRVHPDKTSRTKPTPQNQIDLHNLLNKYDKLVDDKLPKMVKELKKIDEIMLSWGGNRKHVKGIVKCLEELEQHINNLEKE